MKSLVIYSSPHEGRHIRVPKLCVGQGYRNKINKKDFSWPDLIIIFGSCGITEGAPHLLYMPKYIIAEDPNEPEFATHESVMNYFKKYDFIQPIETSMTVAMPLHKKGDAESLRAIFERPLIVDMETWWIARECVKHGKKYVVLRYPVDYLGRKLKPPGINYVYRKFNHSRNSLRVNNIAKYLEFFKEGAPWD